MSEGNVERYEVEDNQTGTDEPDVILVERDEEQTRGELMKFAILAVVLLGTVLVIALLRPYIFNTVIPAVLGEDQPAANLINTETEAETLKPETEEETEAATDEAEGTEALNAVENGESEAEATEADETETNGEDAEASEEPVNPEDFPTAVPTQTHTVQPGETLTAIARQYGVTLQAIIEANEISNPDRVAAGTVLTIPDGQ